MCCACRCILRSVLYSINNCYLVIAIVAFIFFGIFKWGCYLFLNALADLMKNTIPNGLGAGVKTSELATLVQGYFDIVAWILFSIAMVFLVLCICGNLAITFTQMCSCLGWVYIGILSAALVAEIIFIIIWFATTNARVQSIKSNLKQEIKDSYQDFWQISINNLNIKALTLNFVHAYYKCCGISDTNPQWDYQGAVNWNRTLQIPGTNYWNQTVIPLTCCKTNASYWPLDITCPLAPTTDNAYLSTSCYDTLYKQYVDPVVWIQWLFYVFFGAIIIAPGVLMFFLMKLESLP